MDKFASFTTNPLSPARDGTSVVPDDSADLAQVSRMIYVGGGGNLAVKMQDGIGTLIFENIPDGAQIPIRVARILSTGTTATGIIALW
jgi:hypothetical protein